MDQRIEARSAFDRAQRADAIIILGAAVWPNERASPALTARVQRGVELYRAGYAPNLTQIVRVSGGLGRYPPTEPEAMRRLARAAGVPASAIVLEEESHSTEENLARAHALMETYGWRTAVIVTAP